MNLDDMMEVWRAQDTSPLVNKTQLHHALRQEQAKLQKLRRRVRWFIYVVSAILFVMAALFLAIMIYPKDYDVLFVWDYAIAVVGVVSALVIGGAIYVTHRALTAREQDYGDSLRDQLRRRIAQLDDAAVIGRRLALTIVAAGLIGTWAITFAARRINDVPYSEMDWSPSPTALILGPIYLSFFVWAARAERRRNLARKRQLEALLHELDRQ